MTDATRCPDCGGAGKCPICSGYGTVSEELRSLRLKVNAENARLRQLNAELLAACEAIWEANPGQYRPPTNGTPKRMGERATQLRVVWRKVRDATDHAKASEATT